jgi:4-hydroxybenzoate polyprenyltransferase
MTTTAVPSRSLPTRLRHLLELIRFSHTVFALPFALLAALMAWAYRAGMVDRAETSRPWQWRELAGIVLCMVFARSAAMAFNRIADRRLDAANPRTRGRHLPSGILGLTSAIVFTLACAAGFVASSLLFLPENPWPLRLSVPVLLFLCGYSYAKRFTWLAHFWLGTALMLAPICAWIAIVGCDGIWPAVLLGVAILLWVSGFDMIYACQDAEIDRAQGLFSVPARFGIAGALRLAALCHAAAVVALFCLPLVFPPLGWLYYIGLAIVTALLIYEHALVRPDDLTRVNQAFFHVNAVISIGLLLVGALDLWL